MANAFLHGRLVPFLLLIVPVACTSPAPPSPDDAPPAPPGIAEATVRRIESRADVPLRGPRVEAKKGDWLVQSSAGVAVVSAAKGAVIDFGAEGGDDSLVFVEPTVFFGIEQMTSIVESVAPAGPGGRAVLIRKRILSDPALRLWSYVTFADGALRIESVAIAADRAALAVTLGEVVSWGNVPTWVEGHGFVGGKISLPGDFIAREGEGVSYAMATEPGHVLARFGVPGPGFHESARTGERVDSIPAHGASPRRVATLAHATGALGEAALALPRFAHEPRDHFAIPVGVSKRTFVEVNHCDGSAFARFDARSELELPRGCWRVRLAAPGHAPGEWFASDAIAAAPEDAALPRAGTLRWNVRGKRVGPIPARILVQGIAGTSDPNWGEEPADGASLNVIHIDRDGEKPIPPGRYHVTIGRGFEYSMVESDIAVAKGKTVTATAELDRVVDTRGWIAADLHVHAVPSPDAPIPLADRVRALAAAGIEVAVATDHNAVTDYGPTIREFGLSPWLTSIVGDEVTTRGVLLGHFNVFPLAVGSEPIPFDHTGPPALVSAARAAAPADRAKVVQLNHPRMGSIGYFDLMRFDRRDVAGWRGRSALAETGFDAIEVFNGDDYAKLDEVERVMRDWYALLDAGIRMTATGNSDSHKLTYHECGVPRNLVRVGDDDPATLDEAKFVDAVRRGRVIVSSGPVVMLDVEGREVGETAPAGDREIHVTVDAPQWVDVSEVEIVRHGETLHRWKDGFTKGVHRLDARFMATLAKGDWIVAIARGDRPMTFLARSGAKPLSFTNPVWIQ